MKTLELTPRLTYDATPCARCGTCTVTPCDCAGPAPAEHPLPRPRFVRVPRRGDAPTDILLVFPRGALS